jgi:hypothetical protein
VEALGLKALHRNGAIVVDVRYKAKSQIQYQNPDLDQNQEAQNPRSLKILGSNKPPAVAQYFRHYGFDRV